MNRQFEKLKIKNRYRSNRDNIFEDFFEKCLERSKIYDRAVGYFTSGSLKLIFKGLDKFIKEDGKIRIITSPKLTEKDLEAIKIGEELKLLENNLLKEWEEFIKEVDEDILKIFAWMISKEKLEIKVAYQKDFLGIYHEKFGIFKDEKGNKIAFSGSVNETVGGMKNNFESIDTYNSLDGGKDVSRIEGFEEDFEELWRNETQRLNVISLPEAIKEKVLEISPTEYEFQQSLENFRNTQLLEVKEANQEDDLRLPKWLKIRPYQQEALDFWINNKGRGILEMATGTGKTITALTIMSDVLRRAREKKTKVCYIILCPQKFLVEQWAEEVKSFGKTPIICNSDFNNWEKKLKTEIDYYKHNITDNFVVISTMSTFLGEKLQNLLSKIYDKNLMLVVDECHNIGSKKYQELLECKMMKSIQYRLGLSATPERNNDELGNKTISDYLGEIIYKFDMEEAIKGKFLTPYNYYIHFVKMNESEESEYQELSKKINKLMPFKDSKIKRKKEDGNYLEVLLFQRARILHNLENKRFKLIEILKKQNKIEKTLIYCGAGKNKNEEAKSIDIILKKVKENFDVKIKKFTSEENKIERNQILNEFNNNYLDGIIAIKCLDEGVNIPSIKNAYILASSQNPREYIQRRGRVLRLSKGKKNANIHDFLVVPSHYIDDVGVYSIDKEEKLLLKKELKRVKEFSRLSLNYAEIIEKINILEEQYNL